MKVKTEMIAIDLQSVYVQRDYRELVISQDMIFRLNIMIANVLLIYLNMSIDEIKE